jgi:dephospho-CoA kinase
VKGVFLTVIIGLTGGIATGKSTVSAMLAELGAAVVDADQVAREVVLPGEPALRQVAETFGQAVLNEDGTLNRKKLGEIVFADEMKRKALEAILHPAIRQVMNDRIDRLERENPGRLVVADIPLLYETGLDARYPEVLVVYVPPDVQLERLMKRDGLTEAKARERLNAQLPIDEKKKRADWVIDNSGTLEETRRQVLDFWRKKVLQ